MTGGLRATRADYGWLIGPLRTNDGLDRYGPVPDEKIGPVCAALGVSVFGADEITAHEGLLPARIWTPLLGKPRLRHQPADTWAWIAKAARVENDTVYATIAANISVSLRAAGIRLRDASDEYHRQLAAALERNQACSLRFANVAMMDLHLAFHSLLAELASARDYVASFAGRRIGAPVRIDALSRLVDWLERPDHKEFRSDSVVSALLEGCDAKGSDPWLFDIGEYRNQFLHREPIGTNEYARWMTLEEHESTHGATRLIQMLVPGGAKSAATCDALVRFVGLHAKMCRLADFVALFAPYEAKPIHIKVGQS